MPDIDCALLFQPARQAGVTQKGPALEAAVQALLETVPGVREVARDEVDVFQAEEVDLIAWNDKHPDGLSFLPDIFLVECKNWTERVGAEAVDRFYGKIVRRGLDFGILVAANGITGEAQGRTAANQTIAEALRERRRLIVFTLEELEEITSTEEFCEAVRGKIMQLVRTRGQFSAP